jgi:hypothetical protein
MKGYKLLTHDYCPPLQGGRPVWDGKELPFCLPRVDLDTGPAECAAGWNFTKSLVDSFKIAGLWPNGRPSLAFVVECADCIERGNKCRSAELTLVRRATEEEIAVAIEEASIPFKPFEAEILDEQLAWRTALARPKRDESQISASLQTALLARGLDNWRLKRFRDARDAWDARVAWAAWDARDALIVFFASKKNWIKQPAELLTMGIRDAYASGLEIAVPVGDRLLGWA